jgi:hypothetical protein
MLVSTSLRSKLISNQRTFLQPLQKYVRPRIHVYPKLKGNHIVQVLPWTVTDILECDSGGPAGAVYAFLIVWAGLIATFISISEMVSM